MKVVLWPLFIGGYLATLDGDGDGYGYGGGDYFDDVLKTNRR